MKEVYCNSSFPKSLFVFSYFKVSLHKLVHAILVNSATREAALNYLGQVRKFCLCTETSSLTCDIKTNISMSIIPGKRLL